MTVRDRICASLEQGPHSSLEISQLVGIPQGDVAGHLAHLDRSLSHRGRTLEIDPARCLACGFVFDERSRHRKPSRCPQCRSERIDPPRFSVQKR